MATNNSVNTYIVPETTREVIMPSQPAFYATQYGFIAATTGDGTLYTVTTTAEIIDQNSDFNLGTATFTAPVDGRYLFNNLLIEPRPYAAAHTEYEARIVTSNRTFLLFRRNPFVFYAAGQGCSCSNVVFSDLDSADTMIFQFKVSGGTKTVFTTSSMAGFLVV